MDATAFQHRDQSSQLNKILSGNGQGSAREEAGTHDETLSMTAAAKGNSPGAPAETAPPLFDHFADPGPAEPAPSVANSNAGGGGSSAQAQRQPGGKPSSLRIRSPAMEEAFMQLSDTEAAIHGVALTAEQIHLAQAVFGKSIDYARVRLIPSPLLEFRTVGNTIRVPRGFAISGPNPAGKLSPADAAKLEDYTQAFIHELTHVWQYQHFGTSYISVSLSAQLVAAIKSGDRNGAYEYQLTSASNFYEFLPEQQALIVENYFAR